MGAEDVVQEGVKAGMGWAQTALQLSWPMLAGFLAAAAIWGGGWMASKWAREAVLRVGRRAKLDEALLRFLASLMQYTLLVVAIIAGLGRLGVETASLVTVLASAGLAVGLALQGSLSNFASGVMILFFRPFDLHDFITVDALTGEVIDMGLFNTVLRTRDHRRIIVPNTHLTTNVVQNHTATGTRRLAVEVGVAYGSDLAQVEEALFASVARLPVIAPTPPVEVIFTNFGASSLDFQVLVSVEPAVYNAAAHALRLEIYRELAARRIEIPFQQVVLHQAPPPRS